MQSNQKIKYHSATMDARRKNSYWSINNHEFPVGAVLGSGTYGVVQECNGLVSKRISYQNISNIKHIKNEVFLIQKRYGFAYLVDYKWFSTAVICMPFIPGDPLYVKKKVGKDIQYTISNAIRTLPNFLKTFLKIAIELYFLHVRYQIVHEDFKLQNLRIYKGNIYIIDFGLSRSIGEKTYGVNEVFDYLAPETKFETEAKPSQDVFSLGKIFLEYDQKIRPLSDPDSSSIFDVPGLSALYRKMTRLNADDRISLVEAIHEYVALYNRCEFGRTGPIVFKDIDDFKPSPLPALPEVLDRGLEITKLKSISDDKEMKVQALSQDRLFSKRKVGKEAGPQKEEEAPVPCCIVS